MARSNDFSSRQTGTVKESIDRIYFIMAGIVVVLVIGFITLLVMVVSMILTSSNERTSTFQGLSDKINSSYKENKLESELIDQIKKQNDKIDRLTEKVAE